MMHWLEDPSASALKLRNAMQIGVWHLAQWRLLESLIGEKKPRPVAPGNHSVSPVILPDFLPALIVRGQEWYFLTITRAGRKTILWQEIHFGTTRDIVGVY
ncbi:hypothetical protein BD289DRAFT_62515 [Coniella lustricola]|uniref:PD-(D/E)XK nuclease-like domain-containing protein n=1 Tax=Coniella lustricola TaxID=2025994 RepID=A0A2T3A0F0_9PEZI|nr:hypothetical protein BD289DRAFT_62515 [Coniella lustricola]